MKGPAMAAPALTRRKAISLLAVTAAGGVLLPRAAFAQSAGLITGADVCVITPQTTEGPYYFDPALVRTDITEGRPGVPVRLRLQVVDAACVPLPNARIDIWHCDAEGIYSGYNGFEGATFMRGTQMTGADGVAEFETVYPGWYPGRTTHIHFKAFPTVTTEVTGQIFFPDDVSDAVYAAGTPYSARGGSGTYNTNDGIARQAGAASVAEVTSISEGYDVAMIIGIGSGAMGSLEDFGLEATDA
jgi:protocatechuate 3,4-dioxygenase beta subunit